jgi:hypothetical protein
MLSEWRSRGFPGKKLRNGFFSVKIPYNFESQRSTIESKRDPAPDLVSDGFPDKYLRAVHRIPALSSLSDTSVRF